MAERIVEIASLDRTPLVWINPAKYPGDTIVLLLPNSADFPTGSSQAVPNGVSVRPINFTDSDDPFIIRCQGTDTVQDFSTGDYVTESTIIEEFYRAEYVLDGGQWKIGMLNFQYGLTPRDAGTETSITLVQNDLLYYNAGTTNAITMPNSAHSLSWAQVGLTERGGSNAIVTVTCQGSDTIEAVDNIGNFAASVQLKYPFSHFEWTNENGVWKLTEKLPRDPRIGEGTFTPRSNVGETYQTTLSYTVGQHGKQNMYVNLEFEWIPGGGNQDKDIQARWTINGVERESRRFYDINKAEASNAAYTFSPWIDTLVPGDVVNIDIKKNNTQGTLNTTNGIIQLMGPFI